MEAQPLYLISCMEWSTGSDGGIVGYSHEMVYPNETNGLYPGISGLELLEYQIGEMGIERFPYIQFEDEVFAELQQKEWDDEGYLSFDEQRAMVLSEYQARGCLEFRNEDLSIYWVKEITEAEYAIYKRCIVSPVTVPDMRSVGQYLGKPEAPGTTA